MCQAFGELGHEVCLFNPRFDFGVTLSDIAAFYGINGSIKIARLPRPVNRIKGLLRYSWSYRWLIHSYRPDLIYIRDLGAKVYLPCAFPGAKIFEAHLLHVDNPFIKSLENDPGLMKFVVISSALSSDYCRSYSWLKHKLSVHHDGADLGEAPCSAINSPISLRPDKLNAGYISNLYPGKGMEMIKRLLPHAKFCHFHILGGKGDELQFWQDQCADASNITFYGFRSPKEVERLRSSFDCLLAPFQSRVMVGPDTDAARWMSPLKIFEYMASRKPIVASDLPVIREVLRDGVNALLCQPEDLQQWLLALKLLWQEPEKGVTLADEALETLALNYTWKVRAKRILAGLPHLGCDVKS